MSLRRFEHLTGSGKARLGDGRAAGHAGEFFDPGVRVERLDRGHGPVAAGQLRDEQMPLRVLGDLGQVRDADDLVILAEPGQASADRLRDFAADADVDFVEYESRNSSAWDTIRNAGHFGHVPRLREHALEREHDAGELAARGDLAQRAHLLARIRGEEELGGIGAGDVKLLSGVGAWLGPWVVFYVFLLAGLLGGLVSAWLVMKRQSFSDTWARFRVMWFQFMSLTKYVAADDSVEVACNNGQARHRLIPFGAVIFVATIAVALLVALGR